MQEEYDLKKLTVKRHGMLSALQEDDNVMNKTRITISLDADVVDYFKSQARKPGTLPYQTQINQALRVLLDNEQCDNVETVKDELLHDAVFIQALADKISKRDTKRK